MLSCVFVLSVVSVLSVVVVVVVVLLVVDVGVEEEGEERDVVVAVGD